tara:strand:+ start:459 stop:1085 length:627 start_codon:yes stop_codon:yes gene_type:complete
MKRQFKGLWIPSEILETDISLAAKMLWGDIYSFTGRDASFWKANATISSEYGISTRAVSRAVAELTDHGLVDVRFDGRVRHLRCCIAILASDPSQIGEAAMPDWRHSKQESITKSKQLSKAKPSIGQSEEYFLFLGLEIEEAAKFQDYYDSVGWKTKGGNGIKDWKATARNWKRNADKWKTQTNGFRTKGFDPNKLSVDEAIDFVNNG